MTRILKAYIIAYLISLGYVVFVSFLGDRSIDWGAFTVTAPLLAFLLVGPIFFISKILHSRNPTDNPNKINEDKSFRFTSKPIGTTAKIFLILTASTLGAFAGGFIGLQICDKTVPSCGYEFEGLFGVFISIIVGIVLFSALANYLIKKFQAIK